MRYLIICLFSFSTFFSCTVLQRGTGTTTAPVPTDLEGPAYDPSTSPVPMGPNTPLPLPDRPVVSSTTSQPAAYGNLPVESGQGYPNEPVVIAKGGSSGTAPSTSPAPAAASPPYGAPMRVPGTYTTTDQTPPAYGSPTASQPYSAPAPNPDELALARVLNGRWVNSIDARETVEFSPNSYRTFYHGQLLLEENMTFHANCPGDCNGGAPMEISCFTVSGPAGTDCYGIIRLTPDVLELSMLGVSTETIVYNKQR